ncbi:hypothetical protein JL49_02665 [Pseudoalteromonas luteoviolacea]|nr:hypothetical protein JL49_02665 [Pseudoalteromonas luteoviolacea]
MSIPQTAAYASGITYPLTTEVKQKLKQSGIDTLIFWAFHVHDNGDIIFNDELLITYSEQEERSQYVGNNSWPDQLASLIDDTSCISQLEASIGGWDTGDFTNIQTIYNQNNNSFENTPLNSNFQLFKSMFPMISLIDMDVEDNYDTSSFIAFNKMLIEIGFEITFCPFEEKDFWTDSLQALQSSNAVKWWNLQCYAGGYFNNPEQWASAIISKCPSFNTKGYILVSDWSRFYNNQKGAWQGDCVTALEQRMHSFKNCESAGGGFLWNVDQVLDYASELKKYPDPCECNSANRSLSDYICAINNGLGLKRSNTMNFDVSLNQDQLTITNKGEQATLPLTGSNAINLPNGAIINPPSGTYWHIQHVSGGASLDGSHGPLAMPADSSAVFKTDKL